MLVAYRRKDQAECTYRKIECVAFRSEPGQHISSVEGQLVNILGFACHLVSVTTQLCQCVQGSHRQYIMNGGACVPRRLYLRTPTFTFHVIFMGHELVICLGVVVFYPNYVTMWKP